MLRLHFWLRKSHLREKSGYLILLVCYLSALFVGFGPFLGLYPGGDPPIVYAGFGFFVPVEAGDFRVLAWVGLVYTLLVVAIAAAAVIKAGPDNDTAFFWPLVFVLTLGVMGYATILNFYAFHFAFGDAPNGGDTAVLWAGIVYDVLLWAPLPVYFLLRNKYYGYSGSSPAFGTGLDDKSGFGK